jgi:hypothetical protein
VTVTGERKTGVSGNNRSNTALKVARVIGGNSSGVSWVSGTGKGGNAVALERSGVKTAISREAMASSSLGVGRLRSRVVL